MLEVKTKKELSVLARTMARGSEFVRYRSTTYRPVHFETGEYDVVPAPEDTVWQPLTRDDIQQQAADEFNILFQSDAEIRSFSYMVAQSALRYAGGVDSLLVRTPAGLKQLGPGGVLSDTIGMFIPNTLSPMLNEDQAEKDRVFDVISEWVGGDEEAESLLSHFATSLAPHWSSVKYILLLGEGRNGKSLLMKMLQTIFGWENCSHVTRQKIAEQNSVVISLNGKLCNIVFDGQAVFLKDSGTEKSLMAGEPVAIEEKYVSAPVMVQFFGLWVEGLNREPKSSDKSSALQKRLVRFQFPNVYALDLGFERLMLGEESLGAFLSLLIDRYVVEDDVTLALAPTRKTLELQLEHMYINSLGLQYLKHLENTDPIGAISILGASMDDLAASFKSWRLHENDLGTWSEPDVQVLFAALVNTERKKSVRVGTTVRKVRTVTSFKPETAEFIKTLKGVEEDDDIIATMVED